VRRDIRQRRAHVADDAHFGRAAPAVHFGRQNRRALRRKLSGGAHPQVDVDDAVAAGRHGQVLLC
jgi:hypothetical protein